MTNEVKTRIRTALNARHAAAEKKARQYARNRRFTKAEQYWLGVLAGITLAINTMENAMLETEQGGNNADRQEDQDSEGKVGLTEFRNRSDSDGAEQEFDS